MKYIVFTAALQVITLSAFAGEIVVCRGEYWAYKWVIQADNCNHEHKLIKALPTSAPYKVGYSAKLPKASPPECWRSIAQMQMDGAKCCINEFDDLRVDCSIKKITY